MKSIYLDYNATTPLDPDVKKAMLPFLDEIYGNPSSIHHVGRRARSLLDEARDRVATVWKSKPSEVVFTSGGTEATNLAVFGTARFLKDKGRHLITSQVEHHAVLHAFQYLEKREGFDVTRLPVDSEGRVSLESLQTSIRPDTILVSIMAANNEVGTLQPVAELGTFCRERGIVFHTDAVQWFGKEPFDSIHQFNADLVSCCAHKLHGPKGAGALFIRSPLQPDPLLFGGGHENERRAGTENLPAIMGFTETTERFIQDPVFAVNNLGTMSKTLKNLLKVIDGVTVRSPETGSLQNTVSVSVKDADGMTLLAGLDMEGICASSGSACSSGSLEPSHVLSAMGVEEGEANALVRFSLGRESTLKEIERVADVFPEIVNRAQSFR